MAWLIDFVVCLFVVAVGVVALSVVDRAAPLSGSALAGAALSLFVAIWGISGPNGYKCSTTFPAAGGVRSWFCYNAPKGTLNATVSGPAGRPSRHPLVTAAASQG
ncbi:hypothetical protein [Micromonospora sp. CNB394]|uniref:hypothetical protein n=1 Tax=Micromonospora sp. CNB394 TaxID=1169151 RepID=UPI00037DD0B3|nr:hypothetical protein [Micromonospora sp. CNB394]